MPTQKKQFQTAVDFIEQRGLLWQERMGLSHFEIEHHYVDAESNLILGSRPKNRPGIVRCSWGAPSGETTYTAFVETRWNYQLADVYFMLPSVVTWDEERLDHIIVHEYTHILGAVEQYLLEVKLGEVAETDAMTASDFDTLAMLYYERMEMATESLSRAIRAGWAAADAQ